MLGASNYTYAEASEDQQLSAWIGAHVRTFEFPGGCPRLVVPDNAETGVLKACHYEPDPALADGILDRLVHNAHRIDPRESMHKLRVKKPEASPPD